MYSYLFDSTKTQHPATDLDIRNFYELSTLKKLLLFLACKSYHIPQEKTARKDVKEESDYHGRSEMIF